MISGLDNQYRLTEVDLNITSRCNMHCAYCSVAILSPSTRSGDMPMRTVLQLFEDFDAAGVATVRIVGGEPFLHRNIKEILTAASSHSFRTRILTNGSAMTLADVEHVWATGIDALALSVDGHTAELHNASRGSPKAFERLLAIIAASKTYGIPRRMMTVVTARAVEHMLSLVRFADEHEFELLNFIVLGLSGERGTITSDFPTAQQWDSRIVALSRCLRQSPARTQVSILFPHESPVPIELYRPLYEANELPLLKTVWRIDYEGHDPPVMMSSVCRAAHNGVSILPNGDVYGCDLMRGIPEFCAGNINEKPLRKIFETSEVFEELRASPEFQLKTAALEANTRDFSCRRCRAGRRMLCAE